MSEVTTKTYVEKLDKLIHNEKNPRYIKSKKHAQLVESLREFPEMKLLREIIIDENNVILAGDKRVYALQELDYVEVTVKQVFGLTEAQKKEFIVKDNVHHGEWDQDILANEWEVELLKDWGVPEFKLGGNEIEPEKNPYKNHEVTCPECGHHFELGESEQ